MKSSEYYYLAKRNFLPDAALRNRIPGSIKKGSKVLVSAVCGKAMASVACLLRDYGCVVVGSDEAFHPPMGDVLRSNGIICLPHDIKNLDGVDLVVVGNHLKPTSLEVVEARERGIPMISGPEALRQIFENKRALLVTGTHGKTTTSGLLTHVFIESKKDPAYMIGGVFQKSDNSYSFGKEDSKFVIYEGDEYNSAFFDRGPKFLQYNASSAILTSIEHDHVDLYPTFEDYKQSFQFLIDDLPEGGFLVIHESVLPHADISKCLAKVLVYGKSPLADVRYEIKKVDAEGTTFSVFWKDSKKAEDLFIPLFGEYNIENALSVFALSSFEGIKEDEVRSAFKNFTGTKERQELLGTRGNTPVIRDYAHHPTAVTVTLQALKMRYPDRRLVAVFEPRSASSKRKVFQDRYAEALRNADVTVIINPIPKDAFDITDAIDTIQIQNVLREHRKDAHSVISALEALDIVSKNSTANDVVVFMSSGDLDGIPFKFLGI